VSTLSSVASGYNGSLSYTYDDNGNILSVSDGTYTTSYVYDTANQLIRENNQAAGKTWTWTYDGAGNIQNRKEYAYTTGTLGAVQQQVNYLYGNSNWGDLLTSYNGTAITSDAIGNMLSDGTWSYTWQHGRELASMTDGTTTWSFTYNADGMRTGRSDGSTTYKYFYIGGRLSHMLIGSSYVHFAYDASGSPIWMRYNGTRYYYVTNLQGDVGAILDANGNSVVQYTFDAWGNVLSITGTMADSIGTINPLLYRGYIYDHDTGLYYLQTRYYNPIIGRFICADVYIATGQGFIGNNMFAYCLNNPIMLTDFTGARAQVWQVIFDDHDPGYIHRAVQVHITIKYTFVKKEHVLPGVGRADIYDPKTHEMWEIKYGGSSDRMKVERILFADSQVSRYINGAKEKLNSIYHKGYAGAFDGSFILYCNEVPYLITYDTPARGVILYYVTQLKQTEENAFAVYPSKEYNRTKEICMLGIGAGAGALAACIFGTGSSSRGLQLGFAH